MPFKLFSYGNGHTAAGELVKLPRVQNLQFHAVMRFAARPLAGVAALAVLTFLCYRLQFNPAATSSVFLLLVIVQSLTGDFVLSAFLSFADKTKSPVNDCTITRRRKTELVAAGLN